MKLRIVAVGILELVLSVALYAIRGYHVTYLGLMGIGIVLIVLGFIWRA